MMKIFHGPQNIGGMAGLLASAQREIGCDATSHCYSTGNFRYKADHEITLHSRPERYRQLLKLLVTTSIHYDVFQFYFGESLTGTRLVDIPLLKKLGKKIFFYFCGCDVRDAQATIDKYEYSACKECQPKLCTPKRQIHAINAALHYANAIFVSTPDLLEFIPSSILLPHPLDTKAFKLLKAGLNEEKDKDGIIRIAHAPTNRKIKGTKYVEEAIAVLKAEGYQVELVLVENLPYEEALYQCSRADLVIDQLLIGAYGQFSVEMMALGKPVICYLRDDLRHHYDASLPILNANPSNIIDVLKQLLGQQGDWDKMGQLGVRYVDKTHDSNVIARKLIEYYRH